MAQSDFKFTWKLDTSSYVKEAKKADKATDEVFDSAEQGSKDASRSIKKTGKALGGLGKEANKTGKAVRGVGKALAAAFGSAAIVAGIRSSVKASSELETKLAEVQTLLGTTKPIDAFGKSLDQVKDAILDLSGGLGTAQELTAGLYASLSAGIDPAESLRFVEQAARLATAGLASTAEAVKLTSSTLNAYNLEASEMGRVSDIAFTIVKQGVTTIGGLSANLGKVIPAAAAVGVGFEELGASIATLTAGGFSVEEATTSMNAAFATFVKNAPKFKEQGIDILSVLGERGLSGALEEVSKATGGSVTELAKLVPETSALKAILALTGTQAKAFKDNLVEMENAAGATDVAFDTMSKTTGFLADELTGKLGKATTKIGDFLIVTFVPALLAVAENMDTVAIAVGGLVAAFALLKLPALIAGISGAGGLTVAFAGLATVLAGPGGVVALAVAAGVALNQLSAWLDSRAAKGISFEIEGAKAVTEDLVSMGLIADQLGVSLGDLQQELIDTAGVELASSLRLTGIEIGGVAFSADQMTEAIDGASRALRLQKLQAVGAAAAAEGVAAALQKTAKAADAKAAADKRSEAAEKKATAATKKHTDAIDGLLKSVGLLGKDEVAKQAKVLEGALQIAIDKAGEGSEAVKVLRDRFLELAVVAGNSGVAISSGLEGARATALALAGDIELITRSEQEFSTVLKVVVTDEEAAAEAARELGAGHRFVADEANAAQEELISFGKFGGAVFADLITGAISLGDALSEIANDAIAGLSQKGGGILGALFGDTEIGKSVSGISASVKKFLGPALSGGLTTALTAIAPFAISKVGGFFKGLFGGKPLHEKVSKDIEKNFGSAISEGLSKAIATASKDIGREAAKLASLGEIFDEIGNAENFEKFAASAVDALALVVKGGKGAEEVAASLNDTFGSLISGAEEMGKTGSAAFQQLIQGAIASGQEIEAVTEFVQGALSGAVEGFDKIVNNLGESILSQGRLDDLATIAGNIADAFIATGGSIDDLIPSIDALIEKQKEAGLEMSDAFQKLVSERNFLVDNKGVIESIQGINQILEGLGKSTFLSTEAFAALGREGVRAFDQLIANGADQGRALEAMAPTLQALIDGSLTRGEALDAETQALVDQAAQMGLVETKGASMGLVITAAIDKLIFALTGQLPDAVNASFDHLTSTATGSAEAMSAAFESTTTDMVVDFDEAWSVINDGGVEALVAMQQSGEGVAEAVAAASESAAESAAGAADSAAGSISRLQRLLNNFTAKGIEFDLDSDIPGLAKGGSTGQGGLHILHPNEFVLNAEATERAGGIRALDRFQAGDSLKAAGTQTQSSSADNIQLRSSGGEGDSPPVTNVQVFIGERELKAIITEITQRQFDEGALLLRQSKIARG